MDGLGLGWIVSLPKDYRPLMLTKSGAIAGFMTYVVLAPTRRVGVFVAVNRINFPMFGGLTTGMHELVGESRRAEGKWVVYSAACMRRSKPASFISSCRAIGSQS